MTAVLCRVNLQQGKPVKIDRFFLFYNIWPSALTVLPRLPMWPLPLL